MAHQEVQTGSLPFLSQAPPPAWIQVVEVASNQGALNMTAQLQEITMRRHRRMAGLLPARNKMLGPHRVIAFFFHEYGRCVGMVPRSSLKEGKNSQMVEKGTRTTQQKKTNRQLQPKGQVSTIPVVFPLCWVKQMRR